MIIAAVGKNASGKDYFLEFISKEFGVPLLSIGDVVRDLAEADGLEKTRENLHATSKKYMGLYGQDFFPKKLIEKIKGLNAPTVLVSGIRPPSDVENFKAAFGDDFFLVGIVVESDRQRWERTVARGSARDNVTFEQFLALDEQEEKIFHTSVTMGMADYTFLRGDFPDEVYHEKIRTFYKERFLNK
ncbi:MAG: AAA family ATPase [Clostridia bacterium]|nr:AAA family ATPase [Clostridia bacterium]